MPEIVKPTAGTTKRPHTVIRNPAVTKAQEFARPSLIGGAGGQSAPQSQQAGYKSAYQLPKNIGEILLKGRRILYRRSSMIWSVNNICQYILCLCITFFGDFRESLIFLSSRHFGPSLFYGSTTSDKDNFLYPIVLNTHHRCTPTKQT